MTAVFALSGCAVQIKDEQFCAPIPGHLGAVCDNFLIANQQIIDEAAWEALQAKWLTAGMATECTNSGTVGDIKAELEKLCSLKRCNYKITQAIAGLKRIMALADKVKEQNFTHAVLETTHAVLETTHAVLETDRELSISW